MTDMEAEAAVNSKLLKVLEDGDELDVDALHEAPTFRSRITDTNRDSRIGSSVARQGGRVSLVARRTS